MLRRGILALSTFLSGAVIGVFIFLRIVGGSDEASKPISAPTLDLRPTATPTIDIVSERIAVMAEQMPVILTEQAKLSSEVAELRTPLGMVTRTPRPTATLTFTPSPFAVPDTNQALFRIVPEESEVRFTLDEDLDELIPGLETTVIGRTNQVAGDILVDFNTPANSRLGVIRINMRTLRTDNPDRDRAIRSVILETASADYEFSDFSSVAITGLPAEITTGDTVNFQISGDFPVKGITQSITFDTRITLVSETELEGYASATINRSAYGIGDIGPIAEDEVLLEINFVARVVDRVGG